MKVLSADEIRQWDQYTISHEPISSLQLMERAAHACTEWITLRYNKSNPVIIFCGKGNNGGDGLAIGRLLLDLHYKVKVFVIEGGQPGTNDFQINLARLQEYFPGNLFYLDPGDPFPAIDPQEIIIDAIVGTGLNRPMESPLTMLINHINESGSTIISIDISSGLYADRSSKDNIFILATHTLSFQCYKAAFLFPENNLANGTVHILDIGLHPGYYKQISTTYEMISLAMMASVYKPRNKFSHKGNYGHALLIAGRYGTMGAAVLSAKGCLQTGVGLLTCHIPSCGMNILQSTVPEAMVIADNNERFISEISEDTGRFQAIATGPGIGTSDEVYFALKQLLNQYHLPIVLDADALNIISHHRELLDRIPPGSILTPHPKEFERLFGTCENDFEKAALALAKAKEYNCIIILKGHHTQVALPNGKAYFNTTGNPGMAKGGSGDVLTGMILSMLAQGYAPADGALLGVYLHGLAGDLAACKLSMESMLAHHIAEYAGEAFKSIIKACLA